MKIAQALAAIQPIRAKTGSRDLENVMRSLVNGELAGEQMLADLRSRSYLFDDFLAAGIDARFSSTAGSGTANQVLTTVAGAVNGEATLKSASDDGTHAANFSTVTMDQLNWKSSNGGLLVEARVKINDISEAYMFLGFTDTISTTVEGPIYMNAAVIDSDATDACGLVYDIDATTDVFYLGGVKAGTDTDPLSSGFTPVDATYFTVRVEVDTNGIVHGFINGGYIGSVADAVTTSVALTPALFIGNRSANQVIATLDYFVVAQTRS